MAKCERHHLEHDLMRGCKCSICDITLCGSGHPNSELIHCNLTVHTKDTLCRDTTRPGIKPWRMDQAHDDLPLD